MQLRNGTWRLVNQSSTNPVIWNGTELASGKEQPLADGDRIEMGEVVFTFRSR
jgi:predicted component of type VI protein secretion system